MAASIDAVTGAVINPGVIQKSASALSPLGRAEFTQQVDVLRLAQRGVRKCRDLWTDFELQYPHEARTAAAWVARNSLANQFAQERVADVIKSASEPVSPAVYRPPPEILANLAHRDDDPDTYDPDPLTRELAFQRQQQRGH